MRKLLRKLWNDDRGNALLIAGAALPLLIGSAGLASDTVQWTLWKRQLQRAADSAALAGVYAKVQDAAGQTASQAVDADLLVNNHTNIPLLGGYPEVTFPTAANWKNGVKVKLALQKELGFSSVFMSSPPVIIAEATAATIDSGVYCVVSLEESSATGITATGNGSIDLGCGMITNSSSITAAIATGSADVHATPIAAVGYIKESDNWNGAELLPLALNQEDPFKDVNPTTAGCPGAQLKINANQTQTVSPGCYSKIVFDGDVTMADGTYIIDGGDLTIGAQAKVNCNSCTFVLTNSSSGSTAPIGSVTINGGADLNLSAPGAGTYKDILFYQDRRASWTGGNVNKINGDSGSTFKGALYFPSQQLQINGTAGLTFDCGRFVARKVEFAGDGSLTNTCPGGYGDGSIMGKHVRLVG